MRRTKLSNPAQALHKSGKAPRRAHRKLRLTPAAHRIASELTPLYGKSVWNGLGAATGATPALFTAPTDGSGRNVRAAPLRRRSRRPEVFADGESGFLGESTTGFGFVIGVANLITLEAIVLMALWSAWYGLAALSAAGSA